MPVRDFYFLHQLGLAMRTGWPRGLLTFLLIFASVVAATALWPRTYQSEARMYLRLGRETVYLDPTATTGQTVSVAESREREVTSVLELLRSRGLCEVLVDQLGVDSILHEQRSYGFGGLSDWSFVLEGYMQPPPQPAAAVEARRSAGGAANAEVKSESQIVTPGELRRRESAILLLMKAINCKSPKNSNVIIVTCSAASPFTAQQRLECLLDAYQRQHVRVNRISGSYDFFNAQAEDQKRRLDAKLVERRDLKNRIGVESIEGQRELLSEEAVAITLSLLQAQAAAAAAEARLKSLLASVPEADALEDSTLASGTSADALNEMRTKLFELEIEQQRLQAQLKPAHPLVKAINEQVAQAKSLLLRQEIVVERSTILEQQKKIEAAKSQRADVDAKLQTFNANEVQLAEIDRQVALLEAEYRKVDENREQAHVDEELTRSQISNVNVAQPPSFAAKPTSPSLVRNLLLGFFVACGSAFVVMFQYAVRRGLIETPAEADYSRMVLPPPAYHTPQEALLRPHSASAISNGA